MMEDALQLGEMPSLSHSDLDEVLSEATESEDESSTTEDWSSSDITSSSDSDSEELEVAPAVTESEAGRLLAARISPELFDNILFYVNVTRASRPRTKRRHDLVRNKGELSSNDILIGLKRCSLVCLFWANKCRPYMFSERTLRFESYEDAVIFRRYVVGGCPRLTPVHQLIGKIIVEQDYESRRSFLHLLYLPAIQDKLKKVVIKGPVPDGFNPAKLDTPHWGIPPCTIVVPSSFLQNIEVSLLDVHLPSFYHVTKYIKQFSHANGIWFQKVTWAGQMDLSLSLPHASSTTAGHRRSSSLTIGALKCTNVNAGHLVLTAVMMNPNCPLHRLSDVERMWMIEFVTLPRERDPDLVIAFDVSEHETTMTLLPFYLAFEEASASTDRSVSALSMVGMHTYITEFEGLHVNLDALANHLSTHPTIRAVVLLFASIEILQEYLKPSLEEVVALATETTEVVLAYENSKDRKAVGVDLATLEPNGRIDTWIKELQFEYWWGGQLSSQMLERQLKKKR